jgi:RimJ/RimL family protein N-acetyltransferase
MAIMDLGAPQLHDDVVALRRWTPDDIDVMVDRLGGDREISRWTRVPWPYERRHAEEFLEREHLGWKAGTDATWAITDATSGAVLGGVGVHRLGGSFVARSSLLPDEVGYWLSADARGRGCATRAVVLVADWVLRDLRRPTLNLQVGDGNDASRRVAERAGFEYLGLVPTSEIDDDQRSFHRYVRHRAA